MKQQTIYYTDELNDDFSSIKQNTIQVDCNFKYVHKNIFWKIGEFVVYRLIMKPFAFIYCKLKFRHKIVNKKVLKKYRKQSYFIYANHTLMAGDAFIPNLLDYHKKTYMVVHADNVSQKGLKNFMLMNGAIPIPTKLNGMPNFLNTLKYRTKKNSAIIIYPEAHVWPYYTKIRPFSSTSFRYPIKLNQPTFCITNTFVKTKFRKTPKVVTFIDGPFFVDSTLPPKEQENCLRNLVYNTMQNRSKYSNYEFIKYEKIENSNAGENPND